MAVKIHDKYTSRANPADANYPTGSFKNRSVPGVLDGTPMEKGWANDWLGARDAFLKKAGIDANGKEDTADNSQLLDAVNTTTMYHNGEKFFGVPVVPLIVGMTISPINNKYPKLNAFGMLYEIFDDVVTYNVKSFIQNAQGFCVITLNDDSTIIAIPADIESKFKRADEAYSRNFKSIIDLKAGLSTDNQKVDFSKMVGQRVEWRGYHTESDGGSNWGIIKQGAHTEDGGSIFSLSADLYVEANLNGKTVNARKFGLKGDWNALSQTGNDDTVQASRLLSFAANGSWRDGKKSAPFFPQGSYLITDTLNIRSTSKFNYLICGVDKELTTIYANVGAGKYAFDSNIEHYTFKNLQIIGNKSESRSGFAKGILNAYNSTGVADIDVTFKSCSLKFASTGVRAVGRGVTIENCTVGAIDYLLEIESPTPWVKRGTAEQDSKYTGMRNYVVRNNRFDVVSVIVRTTNVGDAAQYIHGVKIEGNEGTSCDILLQPHGRVIGASLVSNEFLYSFAGGVVRGDGSIMDSTIDGNIFKKSYDVAKIPASNSDTIKGVIDLPTGTVTNVSVTDNIVSPIRNAIVNAQWIEGLSIVSNEFPNSFIFPTGSNSFVVNSQNNAKELVISGNVFRSGGLPTNNFYYNRAVQKIEDASIVNNVSDFDFAAPRGLMLPEVKVGGAGTAVYTLQNCYYTTNESYCYATYHLSANTIEGTGSIEITLPVHAVAENASVSSFSGTAYISEVNNISLAANELVASPVVNAGVTMRLQVSTQSGTRKMTQADLNNKSLYIVCTAKYRFK